MAIEPNFEAQFRSQAQFLSSKGDERLGLFSAGLVIWIMLLGVPTFVSMSSWVS